MFVLYNLNLTVNYTLWGISGDKITSMRRLVNSKNVERLYEYKTYKPYIICNTHT